MRRTMLVAALAGLFTIGALIAYQGSGSLFTALAGLGWGMGLVLLIHVLQLLCSGLAWAAVFGRDQSQSGLTFVWIRWVRESLNSLLPIAQIGGEIVAVRLLALRAVPGGATAASLVVDLTMEVLSQIPFTLLGLALLLLGGFTGSMARWIFLGLAAALPIVVIFIVAQQRGLFRWVERAFDWMAAHQPAFDGINLSGLHDRINAIYQQRRTLLTAFHLHLLSWLLGAGEVWLILRLLGAPVTFSEAMVLESLGQAIRNAAFVVPAGFGVQEGGFLLLGTLYGLAPETGLALSLAKRLREVLLGVPGLLCWQFIEGRRLRRGAQRALDTDEPN